MAPPDYNPQLAQMLYNLVSNQNRMDQAMGQIVVAINNLGLGQPAAGVPQGMAQAPRTFQTAAGPVQQPATSSAETEAHPPGLPAAGTHGYGQPPTFTFGRPAMNWSDPRHPNHNQYLVEKAAQEAVDKGPKATPTEKDEPRTPTPVRGTATPISTTPPANSLEKQFHAAMASGETIHVPSSAEEAASEVLGEPLVSQYPSPTQAWGPASALAEATPYVEMLAPTQCMASQGEAIPGPATSCTSPLTASTAASDGPSPGAASSAPLSSRMDKSRSPPHKLQKTED
ncbi:unnamed protein product [Prorocentrum cordatum]|uniref:Uncharacterized protein n=1 Tax=Prorocentrum cordatum TaxID=2364126 RepID=A0ABN9XMN4_9DINO|nr:unnamed protein product [Polarella glacialis]